MSDHVLLTAAGPLRAANAVAALLMLEDGRYVMQLRDAIPNIFYPDHWGCFGGAVDAGEDPKKALARELLEELEFDLQDAEEFTRFDFDFRHLGQGKVFRIYYDVPVSAASFSRFVLHEGVALRAFSPADILTERRVTPYDAFAVWLHHKRNRFQP